ncbi:MAG: hypothetical protein ACE5GW_03755 [Planctomycetota bacterium]
MVGRGSAGGGRWRLPTRGGGLTGGLRRLILALLVLGPCLPLCGDYFLLKDGRRIDGTVVRELGDLVSIKTGEGIITVDRHEIVRHEKKETIYDQYLERAREVSATDLEEQLSLYRWCLENGLDTEGKRHLKKVIEINPYHDEARELLGFEWIGGDWYRKGSAEAEARRKELSRPLRRPPKKIPDDYRPPEPDQPHEVPAKAPRTVPVESMPKVLLKMRESVGKGRPEVSSATNRISHFLAGLDDPMWLLTTPSAEKGKALYTLRLQMRVYFVRTQTFYKLPFNNIYRGEAEFTLIKEEGEGKTPVVEKLRVVQPFAASVQLAREDALTYAYYDTIQALVARLSRHPFFKERGAEPVKAPE